MTPYFNAIPIDIYLLKVAEVILKQSVKSAQS